MGDDWAVLADAFVDGAYATVKGRVRTYVLHHQLLRHLPPAPASILDVGGGAAHQSLPLARLGYDITVLDPSATMLERARQRVAVENDAVRRRVRFVEKAGEDAVAATGGRRFDAVLCHGVLMYLDDPTALLDALCGCAVPGGLISIMALNAATLAIRPALDRRWADALAAFDATTEVGVLGTATRADTVDGLADSLDARGADLEAWYGVWLFCDWLDLDDERDVEGLARAERAAAECDPYRAMSRVFHLVARTRR